MRNTKVTDIGIELEKYGVKMTYSDPWVTEEDWNSLNVNHVDYKDIEENSFDAIIVAVNHSDFVGEDDKIDSFCTKPKVIIDVKGALVNPDWRL